MVSCRLRGVLDKIGANIKLGGEKLKKFSEGAFHLDLYFGQKKFKYCNSLCESRGNSFS